MILGRVTPPATSWGVVLSLKKRSGMPALPVKKRSGMPALPGEAAVRDARPPGRRSGQGCPPSRARRIGSLRLDKREIPLADKPPVPPRVIIPSAKSGPQQAAERKAPGDWPETRVGYAVRPERPDFPSVIAWAEATSGLSGRTSSKLAQSKVGGLRGCFRGENELWKGAYGRPFQGVRAGVSCAQCLHGANHWITILCCRFMAGIRGCHIF